MLTIHPASLRAAPGDAGANATANALSMPGADPAGFASLLRQSQTVRAAAPAPAPASAPLAAAAPDAKPATPAAAATDDGPNEAAAPTESNDPASRNRALARSKLRAADAAPPNRDANPGSAVADAAQAGEAAERRLEDEPGNACDAAQTQTQLVADATPVDPSVMHWLAGLQRAVSGRSDDAPIDTDGRATADDSADRAAVDARSHAKGRRPADLDAAADLKDKAAQGQSRLADAASASQFAGVLAEQRRGDTPAQPLVSAVDRSRESAAASAAAFAPIPTAGTDSSAPLAVALATPVSAPDFAQELGLRLAVLAKDGVQTAELHLNPADMGPVSVQIVMDGTQARVDFGADMAATRQAIEAGLPALASALADAGFTLAGGGVSQHAGGRNGGHESGSSQGDDARRSVGDDQLNRVATAARSITRQGGVDVFA
ncbi:MAG: flagellar hook-length control protein FliK [Pseudomonadota bacterium]